MEKLQQESARKESLEAINNIGSSVHNEPMFNGWDADIILPQYKLAILWNGPWHYKQVTKEHNLKQVQNRDRIKKYEIEKTGYTCYIIKDIKRRDKNKIEIEFNRLLKYLQ